MPFSNQAHGCHRPARAWILRIAFIHECLYVCVCLLVCVCVRVCVSAPEAINN